MVFLLGQSVSAADPKSAAAVPLNQKKTILLDKAGGKLLLKTTICLRQGVLEMLICPRQTKEHESILTLDGKAQVVHAGLLALGAQPGHPAQFQPKFIPPTGQKIEIFVNWKDEKGMPQRRPAQEWVRHATYRYFEAALEKVPEGVKLGEGDDSLRYDPDAKLLLYFGTMSNEKKREFLSMSGQAAFKTAVESLYEQGQPRQLEADFVFAGSAFAPREDGSEVYLAEAGSLVCVANFGDALIDLNMQSTASNDAGLLFEPWTERLPPEGTEVEVELIVVAEPRTNATGK
jgi:hypothetical protein